jgi:hypothetical protein
MEVSVREPTRDLPTMEKAHFLPEGKPSLMENAHFLPTGKPSLMEKVYFLPAGDLPSMDIVYSRGILSIRLIRVIRGLFSLLKATLI